MIFDHTVAFIPATDDRTIALELRHPGIVKYLVKVFGAVLGTARSRCRSRFRTDPVPEGISGVRHSIAKLLVEGHVDEAIARRLGMNVRTCRSHIAKLSVALGSNSRAQLGYLIARSGILESDS
ncbi:HTH luxR-type domain-containing protein OS=Streptomyces microflavus OX=1919 GN=Smic_36310 PE=4 SV=1 [Streptomyces microflavus]